MTVSQTAIDLIKQFEGCKLEAYQDIRGIWTIGYGHTANVTAGMVCTQEQADQWLLDDATVAQDCVLQGIDTNLADNQIDALVDFVFNLGCGAYRGSTLRLYVSKAQFDNAANEFPKWCHYKDANGVEQVSLGLLNRRNAEKDLFTQVSEPEA